MRQTLAGFGVAIVVATGLLGAQAPKPQSGVALSDLSWIEAEGALTPSSVVVIPLGVATVQHGPHLKLNNNERLARYLGSRVQAAAPVVVAPPLTYHFYPTFLEYAGSTSLSQNTARDMTIEIVRSLARYGPRRFYVLNTGVSTMLPLGRAAETLANDGILLGYTDIQFQYRSAPIARQQMPLNVAHADEIETSVMLYVDPSAVDMTKAVREYGPGSGPMTRQGGAPGVFSASGVLGDPTLATREKGQVRVETLVAGVLADIEKIRSATLPAVRTAAPLPPPTSRMASLPPPQPLPNGCAPEDERTIRNIGTKFSGYWMGMNADGIAGLFWTDGDMRHPDGTIERTAEVIKQNRQELFKKKEYRGSVHPVSLNDIRCITPTVAIADGKWELRLMDPTSAAKPYAGWCTLVLRSAGGGWLIEAWRYTVNPTNGPSAPTILKQPGFIGRAQ